MPKWSLFRPGVSLTSTLSSTLILIHVSYVSDSMQQLISSLSLSLGPCHYNPDVEDWKRLREVWNSALLAIPTSPQSLYADLRCTHYRDIVNAVLMRYFPLSKDRAIHKFNLLLSTVPRKIHAGSNNTLPPRPCGAFENHLSGTRNHCCGPRRGCSAFQMKMIKCIKFKNSAIFRDSYLTLGKWLIVSPLITL
jgi:hypothetical protein